MLSCSTLVSGPGAATCICICFNIMSMCQSRCATSNKLREVLLVLQRAAICSSLYSRKKNIPIRNGRRYNVVNVKLILFSFSLSLFSLAVLWLKEFLFGNCATRFFFAVLAKAQEHDEVVPRLRTKQTQKRSLPTTFANELQKHEVLPEVSTRDPRCAWFRTSPSNVSSLHMAFSNVTSSTVT